MTVLAGNWTNRLKMIPSLSGASIHVVFEERTVMPIAHRASPEAVSAVTRRTDVAARDDAPCIDRNRLRRRRAECHAQRVTVHVVCGVVRIAVVADAQRRAVGFAHFECFRCGFEREGRRGVGRFVSVRTVRSGEAEPRSGEDQGAGHDE